MYPFRRARTVPGLRDEHNMPSGRLPLDHLNAATHQDGVILYWILAQPLVPILRSKLSYLGVRQTLLLL